jgi:hypothetical protein
MVGYVNCSPFEALRGRGKSHLGLEASFQDVVAQSLAEEEANPVALPNPTPSPNPNPDPTQQHKIRITPKQTFRCGAGDYDIIRTAVQCNLGANFLLTTLDNEGEKLLWQFQTNNAEDINNQLLRAAETVIQGPEVDIFLCLDANHDGRCADEQLVDLNKLSEKMDNAFNDGSYGNGNFSGLLGGSGNGQGGLCGDLAKGLVFYHLRHEFINEGPVTATLETDPHVEKAAEYADDKLQNLSSEEVVSKGPSGEKILTFPIELPANNDPRCGLVRISGCFAEGTKIKMSKDVSVPVNKLRVGMSVYLADGRLSKIKRFIAGPESKPMIIFETAESKIMVTSEHPLVTDKGVRLAKEIGIGEQLKAADGKFVEIKSIGTKMYKDNVYNFELEGSAEADHLVVAEGLISGDLYLQNKLSKSKAIAPALADAGVK